jgi:hypothetical protein
MRQIYLTGPAAERMPESGTTEDRLSPTASASSSDFRNAIASSSRTIAPKFADRRVGQAAEQRRHGGQRDRTDLPQTAQPRSRLIQTQAT